MTQADNALSNLNLMHLVIFDYAGMDTEKLKVYASRVISPKLRKKTGKSESRMRSYYAGRSAIAWYAARRQIECFVAPNQEFGFLEIYDASAHKKTDLLVNLTHTENIAVAVFGKMTAGVDVESRKRSAKKVLPRVASSREQEWVKNTPYLPSHPTIPTDIFLWSAKEAFSKALGLGMKFGFQAFQIEPSIKAPFNAQTTLTGPLKVEQPKILLETFGDFLITVCTDEKQASAGIYRWVLSGLDFDIFG